MTMTIKNNIATFHDKRHGIVETVDLKLITTHQDIAVWIQQLEAHKWFTGDVRQRFESECLRRVNRY